MLVVEVHLLSMMLGGGWIQYVSCYSAEGGNEAVKESYTHPPCITRTLICLKYNECDKTFL